jgi:CheY-like chemotaxis protein/anti-sigma regulatory factor (Ser/Thr protein kinase)
MRRLAETHELTVTVTTEPTLVQGDPVRLEQVVCNLLHNAIKYTPRGGAIEVEVGSSHGEPGEAVIRVRDTGLGIAEDMLTRIFEPFTQVESSRKRSEGGLGLGLPLVRSLVELHGGTVEARSEGRGQGSEFIVRLPRLGSEAALPVPAAPGQDDEKSFKDEPPLRILVVEDNRDGRESLRDLLEIWGHRVEVAENGPEGVKHALGSQLDVALIDIGLPGLDGNEVAQRIRAALDGDRMALVAMTGYGQPEDRRRALQAGFDAYLVKPVDPDDLARTLREVTAGGSHLVRN